MSSCCSSSGSSRMGSSTVAWGPYGGEPIEDGDERADIPGSGSTPDRLAQIELGTGVALFELSPVFVSSPTQGADLVAAHDYGDGQQLLVVVSAGHIWLNYQVGRCQPYVKSFGLPGPCVALALAPDGVRMALIGADAIVHIVDVDDAIRSPQIDYEPVTLGAEVNPHALCWWRDSAGRDLVVVARADRPGAVVIDVEMLSQEPIEIGVEIADIQALCDDRLLLRDVDGAYYWLGDWRLNALARFRRGVSIRAQSHCRDGPVWSVYTPSRSILELFGPDLKGAPISAHLVPESRQQIVFDNYIFCISSDKIEVVSLVLSDIHFEFTSSTGAAFDVALATMQTIPTSEPLTAHVISSSMGRAAQDHPPLLAWSSTAVRRVFRSSSIIDLVEIVVSAFVDRAGDSAPLPSPDQIALLALSLRLDPPDFFEFAGDRAWSVERNFAVAFDFYQRSQLSFHKLVRLCMEASRHCDIVDVVDGVLAQRPALTDKNRGELAHCQFFCLLHACLESGDDQRLFKFGRRSRDLDARRALDALRATNDLDLMLRWCLAHDLVDDYLAIRAQGSTRSLSSQEVDVLVEAGHRSAILANEIVFLALDVGDQLRLLVADVDSVGDRLWSALLTLPFRIPSASLPSLFRTLKPLGAMIPIYILSALLLLDTIPGYLDQSVLATQLEEWRPLADYPKLIEICLAQNPPLRMGAALLLEHNQNRCEAALTRLSAASEVFVADRFVRVLMAEIRKLDAVDEKSLLILMAQQIWQHKSSSPFESVLVPFVDELAPVILSVPSPWVTSRLFLLALTSSPEMKVFERDDYGGALQRVLASPELLHLLTGSRSVTFTFRHDSPPLPLHVHPCGLLYHHPS